MVVRTGNRDRFNPVASVRIKDSDKSDPVSLNSINDSNHLVIDKKPVVATSAIGCGDRGVFVVCTGVGRFT